MTIWCSSRPNTSPGFSATGCCGSTRPCPRCAARGAELIPFVGVARLQAHYAELDRLIEAARDKLADLTAYCNKGFEGRFREALEGIEPATTGTPDASDESGELGTVTVQPSDSSDTYVASAAARTAGTDVFDALRQRHFEQGILTEFGRDQGCVAFQPSPFFGRFLGEIAYSLNDALRRLEGNTSYYVMSGDGDTLQNYYLGLEGSLVEVGRDLDGIIACCKRKVASSRGKGNFAIQETGDELNHS